MDAVDEAAEPQLGPEEQLGVVLEAMRETDLEIMGPVERARANFEEMLANVPPLEGVEFEQRELGGLPGMRSVAAGIGAERTMLYLHGGSFTIGTPFGYRQLWGDLARRAGAEGVAVDYRLAPESTFPTAVEDCLDAFRALLDEGREPGSIALVGDSAGGGLVVSTMLAARDAGLPQPGCGVALSPWADLRCDSPAMSERAEADPALVQEELAAMAARYLDGAEAGEPLASPALADLSGLAPLLVMVGGAEVLLDDAIELAAQAGRCDVRTTLEIWPEMPHVWHLWSFMLDAASEASDRVGAFVARHCGERE